MTHSADPLVFFRSLTALPRDSGDERRVVEYLVAFAKERNLEVTMDEAYNVIIRKPATEGYENAPGIVLQSHSDMVYVSSADCAHKYGDPLKLVEKDGYLSAEGTSLGADNGIGMAFSLAVLDSANLAHPSIEALFTTGEETGMEGAKHLSASALTGRRMINLDSEWEGVYIVGCAGGVTPEFQRKVEWENAPAGWKSFKLTIQGLRGGHSGVEIDKGRGNAIRLLARVLYAANTRLGAYISAMAGGGKSNAIPDRGEAVLLVQEEQKLRNLVGEYNAAFRDEFSGSDPDVHLTLEPCEAAGKVLSADTAEDVLLLLLTLPINVQTMDKHLNNLVESSNNIGILRCDEETVTVTCSIRSSIRTLKEMMCDQMAALARAAHTRVDFSNDYPEWSFAVESPLRERAVEAFEKLYNRKPELISVHAGLECGFFKELYPAMDMISVGPNLIDVHTTKEKLEIASAQRVYRWLVQLLAALKD